MKRRDFLATVAGGGLAAAAFPAPAIAQNVRELKLVATWTRTTRGYSNSVRRLVARINTATEGQIRIKIFWADQMVKAFESFDAVSRGDADMYHGSEQYWYSRKSPGYAFFGSLPFGMTLSEHEAWMEYMGGNELWEELSGRFNIVPLACGDTGVQMAGWFTKEINSLADFRGLRYRVPGIYAPIIERLGAIPVKLSGGKIGAAFKAGKLDAAEFVGPWPDREKGFHESAKYYYWPGVHSPVSMVGLGINRDVWNSLSESQQMVFRIACRQERRDLVEDFYSHHGLVLQELVAKHGIQLRQLPKPVLTGIGQAAGEVIAEKMQGDELLARIYASFMDARTKLLRWAKYGEESFLVSRRLPFHFGPPGRPKLIKPKPIDPRYMPRGETEELPEPDPQPTIENLITRI